MTLEGQSPSVLEEPSPQEDQSRIVHCLYLFSGPARQADLPAAFAAVASSPESKGISFTWRQVDILRDAVQDDLLDDDVRHGLLGEMSSGTFGFVFASPPCSSFSRAVYSNTQGPKPVRSREYPLGFPWAWGKERRNAEVGNVLAFCAISAMQAVARAVKRGHHCIGMLEHPEDLGRASLGVPASIWQLPEMLALKSSGFASCALFQCSVGGASRKPTRLLSNSREVASIGYFADPVLDDKCACVGPLPVHCGHDDHVPLQGKDDIGFRTSPTSAYPHAFNMLIAHAIMNDISPPTAPPAAMG
jgi:hypothetical protein